MKTSKTKKTSDALRILARDDDPKLRAAIAEQVVRSRIAEVLAAREARDLTQADLASARGARCGVAANSLVDLGTHSMLPRGALVVCLNGRGFEPAGIALALEQVEGGTNKTSEFQPEAFALSRVADGIDMVG